MVRQQISISIDRKLKASLNKSWIRNIVLEALNAEGVVAPVEMGLVITDDYTVQELNRTYRSVDEPTDVLSFHMPLYTGQESGLSFVSPPDGVQHLGEVVISYSKAIQQAKEKCCELEQELALLIVHGVLHLLGHDHELPEERRRMRTREQAIMRKLHTGRSNE